MRTYELVLVYEPRVADEEVMSLSGEVRNLLTAKGGVTVTKTDVWGRRRLAYEIEDVNEGKYVVIYFAAEDGKAPITEVERRLQQNDKILRFLTTRTDEGLKRAGLPIPLEPESEDTVEGFHVFVGGGFGADAGIARELYRNVKREDCPRLVERILAAYVRNRAGAEETFLAFSRRHDAAALQAMVEAVAGGGAA